MARTVTISDEAAAAVDAEAARTQRPVDEIVDEVVRRQLPPEPDAPVQPFRVRPFAMGVPRVNLDCIGKALEELDELER
jgi:hypothetical protein